MLPQESFESDPEDKMPIGECEACRAARPGREAAAEAQRLRCHQGDVERERIQRGIHRIVVAATAKRPSLPSVDVICAEMFEKMGGASGVASLWRLEYDKAKAGSKQRLDHFRALFNMCIEANKTRQEELDLATVSEDQLHEAISEYLEHTFRVVSPDDDEEGSASVDCA